MTLVAERDDLDDAGLGELVDMVQDIVGEDDVTFDEILDILLTLPDDFLEALGLTAETGATEVLEFDASDPTSSPLAFAVHHSRGAVKPYRWLVYLNQQVMAFLRSDDELLFVTAPPRHGKSYFLSQWVPAWWMCVRRRRVGLATYGDEFARTWGRKVRDILRDVGRQYRVKLRRDSNAADRFDVVGEEHNGMFTAGAGGVITGKGYFLGIVDDPVKNREEADSEARREQGWEWWTGTWLTRRETTCRTCDEPGCGGPLGSVTAGAHPNAGLVLAKTILLMTRWHFDDLGGRILSDNESEITVRHIDLPAIAGENDPMGRKPGEALCPEKFSIVTLDKIRKAVGPRNWVALYQQQPSEDDGGQFRREDFRYFTRDGDEYLLTVAEDGAPPATFRYRVDHVARYQILDTAYTRGKRSDFTVLGTVGAVDVDGVRHLLLLDIDKRQVLSTEHHAVALAGWRKWTPRWLGIEKINASLSLFDPLKRAGLVVRELNHNNEGKPSRAETASIAYSQHRIWHPAWRPHWLEPYETTLTQFPYGKHDDEVDVISYAAIELLRSTLTAMRQPDGPAGDNRIAEHLKKWLHKDKKTRRCHPILGRM